jgi:hypothetical protein
MRVIGYAESSCKSGRAVEDVYGNLRVKAAIKAIDEQRSAENGRTVHELDQMYQKAYNEAMALKQPSAAVSSVTGIARLYGMDKDNSIDKDLDLPTRTKEEQARIDLIIKNMRNTG